MLPAYRTKASEKPCIFLKSLPKFLQRDRLAESLKLDLSYLCTVQRRAKMCNIQSIELEYTDDHQNSNHAKV